MLLVHNIPCWRWNPDNGTSLWFTNIVQREPVFVCHIKECPCLTTNSTLRSGLILLITPKPRDSKQKPLTSSSDFYWEYHWLQTFSVLLTEAFRYSLELINVYMLHKYTVLLSSYYYYYYINIFLLLSTIADNWALLLFNLLHRIVFCIVCILSRF